MGCRVIRASQVTAVVVLLGSIASGKTTLSTALAERLALEHLKEEPQSNRFLGFMQQAPERWCLANQIWFLREASESMRQAHLSGGVLDHCPEEVFPIHSAVFRDRGLLLDEEYDLLAALSRSLLASSDGPDLYVVLEAPASVLIERVKTRQRDVDGVPDSTYLEKVNYQRNVFLAASKVPQLRISSVDYDFRRPEHADAIAAMVRQLV
jgi:deoxyadenosine/deoxycytidine kinase